MDLHARRSALCAPSGGALSLLAGSEEKHPCAHLRTFTGVLQADGYAGFDWLYETGRITEAACWAHMRRKFYDLHVATDSPIAREALDRIGADDCPMNESRARSACRTLAEGAARLVLGAVVDVVEVVEEIRIGLRDSLCARALDGASALS